MTQLPLKQDRRHSLLILAEENHPSGMTAGSLRKFCNRPPKVCTWCGRAVPLMKRQWCASECCVQSYFRWKALGKDKKVATEKSFASAANGLTDEQIWWLSVAWSNLGLRLKTLDIALHVATFSTDESDAMDTSMAMAQLLGIPLLKRG